MTAFSAEQIQRALEDLNGRHCAEPAAEVWTLDAEVLCKSFCFSGFDRAFAFMTALALYAEKVDHHPDWRNCYRSVEIRLSTFDVHGLTQQDFDFARQAEKVAAAR